jgi:hypothetical protein
MYIPTSFFSSQGACITATTTITSGTGSVTTGSFISGGVYWQYYSFNNTADTYASTASFGVNLNILSGSTSQAKLLVVAGGGGGGYNPGDQCINPYIDTLGSAGGGGGGGVVYYNEFPLSSGSYEILVGSGGRGGVSTNRIGFNGGISYFNNKSFQYTPFTSSLITSYGGGGGAGNTNNCVGAGYGIGNTGASSGGGSQTAIANIDVPQIQALNVVGGIPSISQGNRSGGITTNPYGNDRAMGGGGALTSSANITDTYNPFAGSPGGSGVFYNLTGTQLGYGAGGGGVRFASLGTGTLTGNGAGWGNPGSGGTGGFGGRFGNIRGSEPGLNGTVIVAWPVCSAAFDCKSFAIQGSGNTISYAECSIGSFFTSSVTLGLYDELDVCLTTLSGSNTPVFLSGSYSSLTLSGSCTGGSILRQKNAYQLLSCRSTHSLYVTLDNFDSYNTGSVLQTTTAALTTTSSCWTITDIIFPVITPVSLTNVNITSSYASCIDCINNIPNNTYTVNYLIVGGGGGGGSSTTSSGGGGGAGQLLSGSLVVTGSITSTFITIGSGGAINTNGSNSTAFSITSIGGGAGGYLNVSASSGGNGGGGAGQTGYETGASGSNGFAGGNGQFIMGSATAGGGGGGASQSGRNATNLDSGAARGGSGSVWINGTFYAGGGGGGFNGYAGGPTPLGGPGGGGRGSYNTTLASTAGTTNRGGGGGGSSSTLAGAAGGSGIVVIAYLGTQKGFGGTITTSGSYTYHTFNSDGTFIA